MRDTFPNSLAGAALDQSASPALPRNAKDCEQRFELFMPIQNVKDVIDIAHVLGVVVRIPQWSDLVEVLIEDPVQ